MYQVLARKWRPQTFSDVVGQEHITETLQNAIKNDRVAHAYIFAGIHGIGKTSCARIFAKALNCQNGPSTEPCNECSSCLEITESSSPDMVEIDGASNNSVEDIRTLRENVSYRPLRGHYRIYLIDEVHMLSKAAFNALLKTLEEPPPHVIFLFATTEIRKLPLTILSRCQHFTLRRLVKEEVAASLGHIVKAENLKVDEEVLGVIATRADGSLRDAQSLLEQVIMYCYGKEVDSAEMIKFLGHTGPRFLGNLVKALLTRDYHEINRRVEYLYAESYDLDDFVDDFMGFVYELLLVVKVGREGGAENSDIKLQFGPDADRLLAKARETLPALMRISSLFLEQREGLRLSDNKRLFLNLLLMKGADLTRVVELSAVKEVLEQLENAAPRMHSNAPRREEREDSNPVLQEPKATYKTTFAPASPSSLPEKPAPRPVAPPPPKAAPPPSRPPQDNTPLSLDKIKAGWDKLLEIVKSKGGYSLYSFVKVSKPSRLEGQRLILAFDHKDNFCRKGVEDNNNRPQLEKIMLDVYGQKLILGTEMLNSGQGAGPSGSGPSNNSNGAEPYDPRLKKIIHKFEGTIIQEKNSGQE